MTRERAYFEASTLREHGRLCPEHTPEVYHFDRAMSLMGMRYIEPPHIILRKGLIAGVEYPLLADHMSDYMAKTLFFTSLLYNNSTDHKKGVAKYSANAEMCRLTEQVVFSDPYRVSKFNRWTSPYLDKDAEAVREDDELKLEAAELKSMFIERAQALIHGDLHTASIMVTTGSTQIIDSEFGFYGPMGYHIGAFLGNLILAYYAQNGHADQANDRKAYKKWILKAIEESWNLFQKKFIELWNKHKEGNGEAYLPDIYNNSKLLSVAQKKYMTNLFHDGLGFGSAKMISWFGQSQFAVESSLEHGGYDVALRGGGRTETRFTIFSSRSLPSRSRAASSSPSLSSDSDRWEGAHARRGVRWLRGVAARAGRLRPRQRVHRRPLLRGRLQRRPLVLPPPRPPPPLHATVACACLRGSTSTTRPLLRNEEDVLRDVQIVHTMIDREIAAGTDPGDVFVFGLSQGGALSIASVLLYPKALGGCAVFGGFLPFDSSSFAARLTDEAKKTPVLWIHGGADSLIPVQEGRDGVKFLRGLGMSCEFKEYDRLGHTPAPYELEHCERWASEIAVGEGKHGHGRQGPGEKGGRQGTATGTRSKSKFLLFCGVFNLFSK
ncbi:uncharacterized protein [Miscanthus floridulus]|uniref:uncharacterized protein isoform X2 n=1 Tax=Miscanthus floridulus TaxID=154761 RepID=UPI00345ACB75